MSSKSTLAVLVMYRQSTNSKPETRRVIHGRFVSFPKGSPTGKARNCVRILSRGSNDRAMSTCTSNVLKPSMLKGLRGI